MKIFKVAALAVVLFFGIMTPAKSTSGGILMFSSLGDTISFCAQNAIRCESTEYIVHPVLGTGWMVAYTVVNTTPWNPFGGVPMSRGGTGGGGTGGGGKTQPPQN